MKNHTPIVTSNPSVTLARLDSLKVAASVVKASALPILDKQTTADLRASVEREGATEPLVVWAEQSKVIDGVARLAIYKALGFEEIPISLVELSSEAEAIEYRVRRNLTRRHMNTWHKARAAYEYVSAKTQKQSDGSGDKWEHASKLFSVGTNTISRVRRILRDGPKFLSKERLAEEIKLLELGTQKISAVENKIIEASNFNDHEPTGNRGKKRKMPPKANKPNDTPTNPNYNSNNKAKRKPLADLLNKVHTVNDYAEGLQWIEDESVDILVTSPPYHGAKYDYGHVYNPNATYEDCLLWLQNGLMELPRIMKPGAAICINVDNMTAHKSERNKYYSYPLEYDLFNMLTEFGLTFHRTIAWTKNVAPCRGGRSGSEFQPRLMGGGYESILVFSRGPIKRTTSASEAITDLLPNEYLRWTNNCWQSSNGLSVENRKDIKDFHVCPFPEGLPQRLIKLFTFRGAVVLDPFSGSGTTAKVAKQLGRDFIAFDKNADYNKAARKRIAAVEPPCVTQSDKE